MLSCLKLHKGVKWQCDLGYISADLIMRKDKEITVEQYYLGYCIYMCAIVSQSIRFKVIF